MNTKILLLLLLGVSFLFFGCAKKAAETDNVSETDDVTEEEETADEEDETTEEDNETAEEPDEEEEELADLFDIDKDKPVGDEGLDVESPSSESE